MVFSDLAYISVFQSELLTTVSDEGNWHVLLTCTSFAKPSSRLKSLKNLLYPELLHINILIVFVGLFISINIRIINLLKVGEKLACDASTDIIWSPYSSAGTRPFLQHLAPN